MHHRLEKRRGTLSSAEMRYFGMQYCYYEVPEGGREGRDEQRRELRLGVGGVSDPARLTGKRTKRIQYYTLNTEV